MSVEQYTIRIRTYDLSWAQPWTLGVDRTVTVQTDRGTHAAIELACDEIWGRGCVYSQRGAGEYVLRPGKRRRVRIITTGHSQLLPVSQRVGQQLDAALGSLARDR